MSIWKNILRKGEGSYERTRKNLQARFLFTGLLTTTEGRSSAKARIPRAKLKPKDCSKSASVKWVEAA